MEQDLNNNQFVLIVHRLLIAHNGQDWNNIVSKHPNICFTMFTLTFHHFHYFIFFERKLVKVNWLKSGQSHDIMDI